MANRGDQVGQRKRSPTPRHPVVMITGGARGLGLELARRYGAREARLALCSRNQEELKRAKEILAREYPRAEVFTGKCDVSDLDDVTRFIGKVNERFGPLDLLINNAGIIQMGPYLTLSHREFDAALKCNLWGAINTCQVAVPQLIQTKGTILNIASIGGAIPTPHLIPYATSKFGLVGFSTSLGTELRRHGVSVVTILPWLMRTGSYLKVELKGQFEKEFRWFAFGGNSRFSALNARRAARIIVRACDRKKRFKVVGSLGKLGRLFFALAPNTALRVFSGVNRMMPELPGTLRPEESPRRGHEFEDSLPQLPFKQLGERAAMKNNEWIH